MLLYENTNKSYTVEWKINEKNSENWEKWEWKENLKMHLKKKKTTGKFSIYMEKSVADMKFFSNLKEKLIEVSRNF